jgi:hypothetical protein
MKEENANSFHAKTDDRPNYESFYGVTDMQSSVWLRRDVQFERSALGTVLKNGRIFSVRCGQRVTTACLASSMRIE